MKRLKMIVPSIVVLTIVSSALAFTSKKNASLCMSFEGPNINCRVQNDMRLITGNTNCWIYELWDGDPGNCPPDNCPTPKRCGPN